MMAMNNFAIALQALDMLDMATMILRRIFERTRQVLGDKHPFTIKARANFTSILNDQGCLSEAPVTLENVQQVLDDEHSSTTSAMHNLAIT